MYKDINGKIGTSMLQGNARLYSDTATLSQGEIDSMLADGILVVNYTSVSDPTPTAQDLEVTRLRDLTTEVMNQLFSRLTGTTEYQKALFKEINMLASALMLVNSRIDTIVADNNLTDSFVSAELDTMKLNTTQALDIRNMSNAAETNGDSPSKFRYDVEQAYGVAPKNQYPLKPDPANPGMYIEDIPVV